MDDLDYSAFGRSPSPAPSNLGEYYSSDESESAKPKAKPHSRCRVLTPQEIWAPIPSQRFLFDGLVGVGKVMAIVASGASFKSWIGLDACIASSTGGMFLNRFPTIEGGPALYCDYEMGSDECRRRLQACALARDLSGPVQNLGLVTMPPITLTDAGFERELAILCEGRSFVCIDSLAAGSADVDENSAAFAKPLQAAKRVAEQTNCTIAFLHHSKKEGANGPGDPRDSVRGTSAIFAACDTVLSLRRENDALTAFRVSVTKQRCGKSAAPFIVTLKDLPDGGVLVLASDLESVRGVEASTPIETQIERALEDGPRTKNQLKKELKVGWDTVNGAISDLFLAGNRIRTVKVKRRGGDVEAFELCRTLPRPLPETSSREPP